MELSEVICKTYYQTSKKITLEVDTTATVDFNDGHPPIRVYCNFDYVPTEWDDPLITDHEGEPQPTLLKWLEVYCPLPEDWEPITTNEV